MTLNFVSGARNTLDITKVVSNQYSSYSITRLYYQENTKLTYMNPIYSKCTMRVDEFPPIISTCLQKAESSF